MARAGASCLRTTTRPPYDDPRSDLHTFTPNRMGLLSRIAERLPRGLRLTLLVLPSLMGFPSPPEPDPIAHTWCRPEPDAAPPDDPQEEPVSPTSER
jgi:hypothetical protein